MEALKRITARYSGSCRRCRAYIREGQQVGFSPGEKVVYCTSCADNLDGTPELPSSRLSRADRLHEGFGIDRTDERD